MLRLLRPYWDTTFAVELALLLYAAPALYFPGLFPGWAVPMSLGLLVLGWIWRRIQLGIFLQRTPMDWPLVLLMGIMLPVSLWASPPPLREELSIPRAYILAWNFCLFWTIAVHSRRRRELFHLSALGLVAGVSMVVTVGLLGTRWKGTIRALQPLTERIPKPLIGVLPGTELGIHPNQLAGTLLYVLPLLIVLTVHLIHRRRGPGGLGLFITLYLAGVLALTQSRAGYLGFTAALAIMLLLPTRPGRLLLIVGTAVLVFSLPFLPHQVLIQTVADAPPVEAVGGMNTFGFRQTVWQAAVLGIGDFPFTGMGLGTFRQIAFLLYPMPGISPNYDIAHAHNFFLQTALDFGLPGLIAVLAVYLIALAVLLGHCLRPRGLPRAWSLGLLGSLLGQAVYSQLDSVSMGAKTNFAWWYLLALVVGFSAWGNRGEE